MMGYERPVGRDTYSQSLASLLGKRKKALFMALKYILERWGLGLSTGNVCANHIGTICLQTLQVLHR